MSTSELLDTATQFVAQIEGPYKWYIISAILIVLTGLIMKFVFKTIKWVVILLLLIGFVVALFWGLAELAGIN